MSEQTGGDNNQSKLRALWERFTGRSVKHTETPIAATQQPITGTNSEFVQFLSKYAHRANFEDWIKNFGEWEPDEQRERKPFVPTTPTTMAREGFKLRNFVNLRRLDPQDIIYFESGHHSGRYRLRRIDENRVKLWRFEHFAIVGNIDDISTFDFNSRDATTGVGNYYPGILVANGYQGMASSMRMPLFEGRPDGTVVRPTHTWLDEVAVIYVKEIPRQTA